MAQVIEGGPSVMNALIYSQPHPSVMNYMQDAYHRVAARVNDVGLAAMESAKHLYESTVNHSAYRMAKAALRKMDDGFLRDDIQPLLTVGALQNAPNRMIPYVMCEPTVKRKFLAGRCEGYGEEYVNVSNGAVGPNDGLWRAVMNGYVQTSEDPMAEEDEDVAAEPNWGCVTYFDDEVEELNLSPEQTDDIRQTHDALRAAMRGLDDPTSRWNASL